MPNVRFLDLLASERLSEWLGLADIHLLPQRADVADLVMPSKLSGMLASGRPVLATALPGTGVAQALRTSGVAVEPGNVDAFVAALRDLVARPSFRKTMGDAARRQAEETLSATFILTNFEQAAAQLLDVADLDGEANHISVRGKTIHD